MPDTSTMSPEQFRDWQQADNRKVNTARLWHIKQAPCTDCKLKWHPSVMTFDHPLRTGSAMKLTKNGRPVKIGSMTYWNPTVFNIQISKLELVCKNCHYLRELLRDINGPNIAPSRRTEVKQIAAQCIGALRQSPPTATH